MSGSAVNRATRAASLVVLLVVFCAFVTLALAKSASHGLCCADDAYFASVAKNVAMGPGYGATVSGRGFEPFHPHISSGPAVILPAAAATWLFGNRHWVPGFAATAYWTLLLVTLFGLLRRGELPNLRLASAVFVALCFLLFPFHFEEWFTLLGEIPAALFVLLGLVVFARAELSSRSVAAASALCSLAFLSKNLTAIFYVALVAALTVRVLLVERRSAREWLRYAAVSGAGFLVPVVAFELYKLVALGGLGAYAQHVRANAEFIRAQGLPRARGVSRWARALEYDRTFAARFGVSVWQLGAISLAATAILLRSKSDLARRLAVPAMIGIGVNVVWFLFFSLGWPRYLVVTLVVAAVLLALVIAASRPWAGAALAGAALLALYSVNGPKLGHLRSGLENGPFSRSPQLENALELTAFIDANRERAPFASQWWATTADLEYYSRSFDVFRHYSLVAGRGAHWVVFNRAFKNDGDEAFNRLVAACEPAERSFEPYALLKCGR